MTSVQANETQNRPSSDASNFLGVLKWRCIGPPRGGRVVAVAGDPSDPRIFYFGACAGGVWKTTDGGTHWENVSDGFYNTASVGAMAVSESDPNVIYVGMGESCIRADVSYGDGVYKSTDGGKTWTHLGLEDTRHIARIRVHPRDSDLVYVAALGHAFGPNEQRGVFRSKDGGKTWERVLFRNEKAGAADLSMDPNNPRILYAAIWETLRKPWSFASGGPDSGIFKSPDGGDTWTEITNNPGLPDGLIGRVGVAVSPAKSGRVWATIEAKECGLFRSDDSGATWERVSDNQDIQARPWYYQHIFADPQDPDTVWVLNNQCWKSVDGGRTFTQISTSHVDNHDLWIDPNNTQRMIEGNDGGACVTFNGGESWSTIYNQLTSQFYHVATDNSFPYRVYGTQQDNSAISVPSRTYKGAIAWEDCYAIGNSESGYVVVHPEDSNIVFSGGPGGMATLLRYDHNTGQVRNVAVWPESYLGWGAKDMKYRFQWTYPIHFSPHDPSILYTTANVVFRSTDEGSSWEAISHDLTRNDVTTLETSGGPITKDSAAAETYGTIFAFAESPHEKGVFWAGSDDGLVHISRDGGNSWHDITPEQLPPWTLISMIETCPHDPSTAYIAASRYKLDDTRPMLFKTNDYGKTWTDISNGIPQDAYTRVIREDLKRRGLLYVGTENGMHISFDDGASWQPMQANLPRVPIYDLVIKDNDLVAATHGRSFWIVDDLTQLHQITDDMEQSPFRLLKPRSRHRVSLPTRIRKTLPGKNYWLSLDADVTFTETKGPGGETIRRLLDAGENPPDGVMVTYYFKDKPKDEITLSFLDSAGQSITRFSSNTPEYQPQNVQTKPPVPAEAGMNRFIWNMRYPSARSLPGDKTMEQIVVGPLAPPGAYQVTLTAGSQSQTETFEILKDPRVAATRDDFQAQFQLLLNIRDKVSEVHDSIKEIRSIKEQLNEWVQRTRNQPSADSISSAAAKLKEKLSAVELELVQADYMGDRDFLNLPTRLNRKLAELFNVVASADFAPTKQSHEVFDDLSGRIDGHLKHLRELVDLDVTQFINLVNDLAIPAIVPSSTV